MKRRVLIGMTWMLVTMSLSFGEPITATSNAFSFPAFSGIRDPQSSSRPSYFRFSGTSLKSHSTVFAWALPVQLKNQSGTISVYSLLGRSIKTFHLTSQSGSMVWKMTPAEGIAGIYLVRFAFGPYSHNLKLIVGK
jgi:hypothetical protein